MQLQHPLAAVSGSVDTDVLNVLAKGAGQQMDAAMLARLSGKSYTGVRHALDRLVRYGTVVESSIGAKALYRFNDRHILAAGIIEIITAKSRLFERMTELIEHEFSTPPPFAAIFGSASRDEMTAESDIDVFLVRPDAADPNVFEEEAATLAQAVTQLTGNDTRVLTYGESEVRQGAAMHPVLAEIARDGVPLCGELSDFRKTVLAQGTTRAAR